MFLTILGSAAPSAYATAFTSVQWKLDRLQASTATTSTFSIDLPGSIDWDGTSSDTIWITFASSSAATAFTVSASTTWTVTTTAQFKIQDGTSAGSGTTMTVGAITSTDTTGAISTGGSWPSCLGTADLVISVNVTDRKFGFKRCSANDGSTVAPGLGNFITIAIYNGTGSITNPATAGNNYLATASMNDESQLNTYSDSLATSIIPSDVISGQGAPAATSTLTFALNQEAVGASVSACSATSQPATVTAGFNSLVVGSMNVATSTICTYVSTNAETAVTVYGYSTNAGLKAGSTYLAGSTYSSTTLKTATASFSLSVADNGYCVMSSNISNARSNATATTPFGNTTNNDCTTGTEVSGAGSLTTSLSSIWTGTPNTTSFAHIIPKAVILSTTPSGTYSDTLYFVAAGTF